MQTSDTPQAGQLKQIISDLFNGRAWLPPGLEPARG
jgi:hypothetical protein